MHKDLRSLDATVLPHYPKTGKAFVMACSDWEPLVHLSPYIEAMNHPQKLVSGVLVLRGRDRPMTAQHALNFLVDRPDGLESGHVPADIDLGSIRGIGEFGGVLFRFTTNNATFERLADKTNGEALFRLRAQLNAGLKPGDEGMDVEIYPTSERFDNDPLYTHLPVSREGFDPDGQSFQRFLAILSADPHIDIASYDRVLLEEHRVSEGWRIYDLACRGEKWLWSFVAHANEQADEHCRMTIFRHKPLDFKEFAQHTLQVRNVRFTDDHGGYLYFRVHCADASGLFAHVDRFARTAPGVDGKVANRMLVRSCCTGIGGQAIVIVAVRGQEADAETLEKALTESLSHKLLASVRVSEGNRPAPPYPPKIQVAYSRKAPAVVGDRSDQQLVTLNFESEENRPGILRQVCGVAACVQEASPSIYCLGSRLKNAVDGSRRFACAIGWVIEPNAMAVFMTALDKAVRPLCPADSPPLYQPAWLPVVIPERVQKPSLES